METTTETREVWTSPDGVEAYLTPVPLTPPDPDDEFYEPWFAESPGARPPGRYNLIAVDDGRVVFDYTVYPYEPWSWYDAISDILLRDGWEPPPLTEEEMALCEHGMSAWLCAGPSHYPMDM